LPSVVRLHRNSAPAWLLIVYTKAKYDNLPTEFLAQLKKGVEDAH
jgi:hypothetical protein